MQFVSRHSFLLMLAGTLVFGFVFAESLSGIAETAWVKWAVVVTTMFVMAWPLEFGALASTVRHPLAPVVAVLINFVGVPLIAWPMAGWLGEDLGVGLLVACAVPTTLATGAVWTRRAGGDDHVAMLVTIVTNSLCFLVTPALVFSMTGNRLPDYLFSDMVLKLLMFVVLPIVVAQAIRLEPKSARWATRNKPLLGKIAQVGVLMMTTLGAIQTGLRVGNVETLLFSTNQLALMVVVVVAVHSLALGFGLAVSRWMGFAPDKRIAIAISGSQKTMMVGLSMSINLGVSILPMVTYHALQLIIDTVVADRHRTKYGTDKGR